jgi:hypothetical protein
MYLKEEKSCESFFPNNPAVGFDLARFPRRSPGGGTSNALKFTINP